MLLLVSNATKEAEDVMSFELRSETGEPLPSYAPGAYVTVMLPLTGDVLEGRSYSLISDPADLSAYRIAVQREINGRGGSTYMWSHVSEGSRMELAGPSSGFLLDPDAAHSILIAGGIGITPILSFLRDLSTRNSSFELDYSCRTASRMAFRSAIEGLADGRVDFYESESGAHLQLGQILAKAQEGSHVYVCGPNRLINAVIESASELGWSSGQVHFESFGPRWEPGDQPLHVELTQSGIQLEVPVGQTILAAVEAAGVWAPFECRRGECAYCVTGVVEGEVVHRDHCLKPEEQAKSMCI